MNVKLLSLLALSTLMLPAASASGHPDITWNFSCDETGTGNFWMYQELAPTCTDPATDIAAGDDEIWQTEYPAQFDLEMGNDQDYLLTLQLWQSGGLTANIVVLNPVGTVKTICASANVAQAPVSNVVLPGPAAPITVRTVNIPITVTGSCMILEGESLGLQLVAGDAASIGTSDQSTPVLGDHARSSLTMAPGDPAFPTPELSSLGLATAGLGLVGLFVAQRRK